ncbi:MAG: hypothetical protein J07HQX50_00211 [Haloquadratum sp. J07HQX50]|jgi:hypothetical protein|nr:MAG: hypothetical protein J07HQX50_00211 [Haloquadratum sp. J07HQX50]
MSHREPSRDKLLTSDSPLFIKNLLESLSLFDHVLLAVGLVGDLDLDDRSMDVYRKKQQWDATSLPDRVISPLQSYRKLMDPPMERWPAFPTLNQRTLAGLVQGELADRGEQSDTINEQRDEYARDLLLVLDEDIRPPSITTDGARSIVQRLSAATVIDIDHPKHDYLAPHGGRREMGEVLVRPLDILWQHVTSTIRRSWFANATLISRLENLEMCRWKLSMKLTVCYGEYILPADSDHSELQPIRT